MGFVIFFLESFHANVGIDLSGGEAGMAEQLLHAAQIGAGIQQMGGEAMAQHVRRNGWIQAGHRQIFLNERSTERGSAARPSS